MIPPPASDDAPASPARDTIGLIGLGLVGSALAERFNAGGYSVLGFDIDAARLEALRATGGQTARSAGEVAADCRLLVLSLPTSAVARAVLHEAAPALGGQHIIIDTTTGDPRHAAELGRELAAHGVAYLDATISGSSEQVRRGEAVAIAGGTLEAFAQCEALFRTFARRSFHVGPCGAGSQMKLVTNLVLGLNRAALAEGLAFARALGLDAQGTLNVLLESPAHSRIMETKGPKMVQREFTPVARLSQHLKDVRLMFDAAAECGASLPLTECHRRLLEQAEAAGLGALDNSAIIRVFERE